MLLAGHLPLPPARSEPVMSRTKSRPVVLSPAERKALRSVVRTGSHSAQQVRRARILLGARRERSRPRGAGPNEPGPGGPGPDQEVVAERAGVHVDTVLKTSRAFADHGGDIQATISRKKRATPPVEPIVTGEVEARLIALACSAPPKGGPAGRCGCWRGTSHFSMTCPTW